MVKYIIKRVLLALVTLFIILSLTFILIQLLPFEKPVGTSAQQIQYYSKQATLGYLIQTSELNSQLGTPLYTATIADSNVYFYRAPILGRISSHHGIGDIANPYSRILPS